MGNDNVHQVDEDEIVIRIESGTTVGYPRRWSGELKKILHVNRQMTVEALLEELKLATKPFAFYELTLESIWMDGFQPKQEDLQRTVEEMGLRSGVLHVWDGKSD
jgi:hypothetical protein